MPRKNPPSYRKHKPSGNAIVTLQGKMFYLGKYGSKESRKRYREILSEYLANDGKLPPTKNGDDITIQELSIRFLDWAEGHYVDDGKPTSSLRRCQLALAPFIQFYGKEPISNFGPESLIFIQEKLVEYGLARETVNKRIGIIRQVVKWGVKRGRVKAEVLVALQAVDGLQAGRTKAPEYRQIEPVDAETVEKTLPYVSPIIADMIRVQRLIGGRPQDVYNMRACDIDTNGDVWKYVPFKHKTKHRGKLRILPIGPKAQAILIPYLLEREDTPEAFLFSPKDSKRLYYAKKRHNRKTKIQPSQKNRKRSNPKRLPGDQYSKDSYNRAVQKACKRAGVEPWSPNQLRHTTATEIRNKYGLDVAQAVLGHRNAKTTEIYAELDFEKAAQYARENG